MVIADAQNTIPKLDSETDSLLSSAQNQLDLLLKGSVVNCKSILRTKNAKLKEEVEDLKKILEKLGGSASSIPCEISKESTQPTTVETSEVKPKAKAKAAKPATADTTPATDSPVDVSRLDFRIGHILEIEKHSDADTLFVEKIDVGEDKPRTVVSGLVKHMSADDLRGKMVVLLCNLKPAKMRGVTSEAMVMCACTPEKVEVLIPPAGCVPGDLVEFLGYPRTPDAVLNPKKKVFETCAPDLKTGADLVALYKEVPFVVPGKGKVLANTLPSVMIK